MYRDTVELQDAVVAVILMESSLASSSLLGSASTNAVKSMIPEHPEAECTYFFSLYVVYVIFLNYS